MSSHFTQLNQNDEATNDEQFTDIYIVILHITPDGQRDAITILQIVQTSVSLPLVLSL